jgi:hypothetical protein
MRAPSWPATILIALLTAGAALLAGGYVADRWSAWASWNQREGAAGYAVALWALVSAALGLVVGAVVARRAGPALGGSFVRTLGASLGAVLVPAAALFALGWATDDPEPELGRERLHLQVELRWPAAQAARPPAPAGRAGRVEYVRVSRLGTPGTVGTGLLWLEDLRRGADGRWVAPGAAPVYSARGHRAELAVVLDPERREATTRRFAIPIAGRPREADRAWSAWVDAPDGFGVRYRVVPRSAVLRTEHAGPFALETVVRDFAPAFAPGGGVLPDGPGRLTPHGAVVVRYRGEVVRPAPAPRAAAGAHAPGDTTPPGAAAVVLVAGPRPALFALGNAFGYGTLIVDDGDRVRVEAVTRSERGTGYLHPVTNDTARFHAPRRAVGGAQLDRAALAVPGLYVVGDALLDTRALAVRPLAEDTAVTLPAESVPLAVSPDGRSVVRYGERRAAEPPDAAGGLEGAGLGGPVTEPGARPVLLVSDAAAGAASVLPIDPARMRFPHPAALDPAWVARHFAWRRGADGADRLVARDDVVPLPHRGWLDATSPAFPRYEVRGVARAFAEEAAAAAARALGGERLAGDGFAQAARVRAGGRELTVSYFESGATVEVKGEGYADVPALVERAARAVDAALATGRYDALFGPSGGAAAPR